MNRRNLIGSALAGLASIPAYRWRRSKKAEPPVDDYRTDWTNRLVMQRVVVSREELLARQEAPCAYIVGDHGVAVVRAGGQVERVSRDAMLGLWKEPSP